MQATTKPKVTITMYNDLPAGQLGALPDVVRRRGQRAVLPAQGRQGPDVLRYWFPPDGKGAGRQRPDGRACAGGKNPVAAHFFINHMLDTKVAAGNFGFIGYQPPQNKITPGQGWSRRATCRRTCATAVVSSSRTSTSGYPLLQLPTAADTAWHQIWQEFKAGG